MNYDDPDEMEDFVGRVAEGISSHGTFEQRILFAIRARRDVYRYIKWLRRKVKQDEKKKT